MTREANSIPVNQKVVKELTGLRAPAKQHPKRHSSFVPAVLLGHPHSACTVFQKTDVLAHQQDADPVLGSST